MIAVRSTCVRRGHFPFRVHLTFAVATMKELCLFFAAVLAVVQGRDEFVHLRINQGLLRGKTMTSRNGKPFYGFLKIPYAEPPLGHLRFRVSSTG